MDDTTGEIDEVRQVDGEQKERGRRGGDDEAESRWRGRGWMLEDKKTGVERGKLSN